MDLDSAKALATKVINSDYHVPGDELVILDENTIEKEYGWIFFYTSREYLATGEIGAMLAGNGPIIVEKSDASITQLGSARPFEDYLREYESKRGHSP
jgi:hypothetical protein